MSLKGRNADNVEAIRNRKGCYEKQERPIAELDSGWFLFMCPGRYYGHFEISLMKDYQRLSDYNILPRDGGLGDQPAWWVEAMDFIRTEMVSWDRILAEKRQQQMETQLRQQQATATARKK